MFEVTDKYNTPDDISVRETIILPDASGCKSLPTDPEPETAQDMASSVKDHWAELEEALTRLRKASDNPLTAEDADDSVTEEPKQEAEALSDKNEPIEAHNPAVAATEEPEMETAINAESSSDNALEIETSGHEPANVQKQLAEIHQLLTQYGPHLSSLAKNRLRTVFDIFREQKEALSEACKTDEETAGFTHTDIDGVLKQMADIVEQDSPHLSADQLLDLAEQIQNLAKRLNAIQGRTVEKVNLKALLIMLERCADQWKREMVLARDARVDMTNNWLELHNWKKNLEKSVSEHQRKVENLFQDVMILRLDQLSEKMVALAEEKQNKPIPDSAIVQMDEKLANYDDQIRILLGELPKQHSELTQKFDQLNAAISAIPVQTSDSPEMHDELCLLLSGLKEKLSQLSLLDVSKHKTALTAMLEEFKAFKASALASDHSIHAALRDLENRMQNFQVSETNTEQENISVNRFTRAIHMVNAADRQDMNTSPSSQDPDSIRAQLVESARSAPSPLVEETAEMHQNMENHPADLNGDLSMQRKPADLDRARFGTREAMIAEHDIPLSASTQESSPSAGQPDQKEQDLRRDLEERIGLLKRIKGSLRMRWSA